MPPEAPPSPFAPCEPGANFLGHGRTRFCVWAPRAQQVDLHLVAPDRFLPMEPLEPGYFTIETEAPPGTRYLFRLDGGASFPDPASRHQPDGVHGSSAVIDLVFNWRDQHWRGVPRERLVIYELHVGAFSGAGTFEAIIPRLPVLRDLGITALELMPIAQFPGTRNWGYDGVYLFAAQNSYGGPDGLRRLVDAAHAHGLAVLLDVVYNHLGPEGNYLTRFGHYFNPAQATPWGPAINLDGPESDQVRHFLLLNALYWVIDCHLDGLRLDAVHALHDNSARPFLEELSEQVHAAARRAGREVVLIAESNLNNPRLVTPVSRGGLGLDAQWNDDFHRALLALVAGRRDGIFSDYGRLADLAKAWREGYVFTGEYSRYRKRRHGRPAGELEGPQFVVYGHNHDHPRLLPRHNPEAHKLVAAAVLLAPFIPLLLMGEEYGERAPFDFFTSHADSELIETLRAARQREHLAAHLAEPLLDSQDEETFARARLDFDAWNSPEGRPIWNYYRELLRLRVAEPTLATLNRRLVTTWLDEPNLLLYVSRRSSAGEVFIVLHCAGQPARAQAPAFHGRWDKLLDSAEARWGGPGVLAPEVIEPALRPFLDFQPWNALVFYRSG